MFSGVKLSIRRLHVTLHKIRKRGCRHVGVPFSDNMAGKEQEVNGSTNLGKQ